MTEHPLNLMDLVCFSHLRWNYLHLRPHHLLTRFTGHFRVFYIEEPIFNANSDRYDISLYAENLAVVVPHLQGGSVRDDVPIRHKELLERLFDEEKIENYAFWYYTPTALTISEQFSPRITVYDCIDEFPDLKETSPDLKALDEKLTRSADMVITSGQSLYELKKRSNPKTFLFPNGVDRNHFEHARTLKFDPADQDSIPHPRIGYFGAVDDRIDFTLLENIARLRPHWHFVIVGPISKVDPGKLPNFHNIHYLGAKSYEELPHYLAGWQLAMIPFVHNQTTRFISPSKTSQYLAGGKPVISTPIIDVIRSYGNKGLVMIAGTPEEFVRVAEEELHRPDLELWLERVDDYLVNFSWDRTWSDVMNVLRTSLFNKTQSVPNRAGEKVV